MSEDREKLLSVFHARRAALVRFLARRVGDFEAAKDLAQETWLKLAVGPAPSEVVNPQAYVFRVASNLAHDHWRAEGRRRLSQGEVDLLLEAADDRPDPAAAVFGRIEAADLARALAEMPERRQAIFMLSRVHGLPHKEIAARFAVSTRTIEKEILRALEHCAGRLGRKLGGRFGSRRTESS